jgi:hypothetical protein
MVNIYLPGGLKQGPEGSPLGQVPTSGVRGREPRQPSHQPELID